MAVTSEQLSVAVGDPVFAGSRGSLQAIVISAGGQDNVGAVWSITVMIC